MPKPDFPFIQVPGVRRTPITKATLWMGPDHLLSVNSNRFNEEYRRFYYADIQAIGVQAIETKARSFAYGVVLFLIFAVLLSVVLTGGNHYFVIGFLVALLAWIISLALRAPNCICYLQTAVSVFELPSLSRMAAAEQALPLIREKISEAQRALAPHPVAPTPQPAATVPSEEVAPQE